MQILCSSPDLLSQNLHINEILGDSYAQNLSSSADRAEEWQKL